MHNGNPRPSACFSYSIDFDVNLKTGFYIKPCKANLIFVCVYHVNGKPALLRIAQSVQRRGYTLAGPEFESCRSQWPNGIRRKSAADHFLGLRVRIPPKTWMFVLCVVSKGKMQNNQDKEISTNDSKAQPQQTIGRRPLSYTTDLPTCIAVPQQNHVTAQSTTNISIKLNCVFKAMSYKVTFICNTTKYGFTERYQRFGSTACLNIQSTRLFTNARLKDYCLLQCVQQWRQKLPLKSRQRAARLYGVIPHYVNLLSHRRDNLNSRRVTWRRRH